MTYLDSFKIESEETNKLKVVVLQNMSICLNNTGAYMDAITQCDIALEIDPKAVKALF